MQQSKILSNLNYTLQSLLQFVKPAKAIKNRLLKLGTKFSCKNYKLFISTSYIEFKYLDNFIGSDQCSE